VNGGRERWQDGRVENGWLAEYRPTGETETADVARMRLLAGAERDPWLRSLPLHFTASAVIVQPESGRVLLRWHQRQRRWLQVGGHGDPGETDPLEIALREAREETGLADLEPWPDARVRHAVICDVAPGKGEPAHEHADLRFIMATRNPDAARPENTDAPLRWLTMAEARELAGTNNLRETLDRLEREFGHRGTSNEALGGPGAATEQQAGPREPAPRHLPPGSPRRVVHDRGYYAANIAVSYP
jgi:8-oxo-dGTP pyrophosphatase MutT (NUDIX family)